MKLTFKRFLSIVLLLFIISFFTINISAGEITELNGAKYYIEDKIDENQLNYGINHYTDISYSSAAEGQVTSTAAGYGNNETFVPDEYYPQQVNVLEIPSSENIKITPWAKISSSGWSLSTIRATITDYEKDNPGYKVIAAINGDFFDINSNRNFPKVPSGVHVSGGDFFKSSASKTIGFRNDGSDDPIVGNEKFIRTEKMQLDIYNDKNEIVFEYEIDHINKAPAEGEVSIFYANFDEDHNAIPIDVNDAFIIGEAEFALPISTNDFYGVGTISDYGNTTLGEGQFSLVSKDHILTEQLKVGTRVRAQFEFDGDYKDIKDAIGVGDTILYDGDYAGGDTARHPRTMIGVREDGTIIMTVVDGRQADKGMYGASSAEMATILKHYGAVEGYNLDGGGSSTMIIKKDGQFQVVNSPSDGRERSDANGILISVKVPIIDYELTNIKTDGFTVNANIIDKNGFDLDRLYVGVNGENITEVIDGKAKFTGLNKNQNYVLNFYQKVGEKFELITLDEGVITAKQKPKVDYIDIYYKEKDLIIEIEFDDPDGALIKQMLYINNDFVSILNGKATINNYIGTLDNILVAYTYNLNDDIGTDEEKEKDFKIRCNISVFIQMAKDKINNRISSLYSY